MSDRVTIECYGLSEPGRVRSTNQDQYLIGDLAKSILIQLTTMDRPDHSRVMGDPLGKLLVVADGMGGMGGGNVASAVALQAVVSYALDAMPWITRPGEREDELGRELKAAVERSAEAVRAAAAGDPELARMGTTLTMAYVVWPRAYLVHAGDSRAYLYRGAQLLQVTRDQTMARKLVDQNVMSEEDALKSSWKDVLWSAIGGGTDELYTEVDTVRLEPGDVLLLCTDGLTKHVSDDRIAEVLAGRPSPEEACRRLTGLANEGGGTDNITVVVAAVRAPAPVEVAP